MASSDTSSNTTTSTMEQLPLKPILGSHGLSFFGLISDRHDYFYHQGRDKFFATRIKKHNSTVIRTNMPPSPFISFNSRVIALPDGASFPILFDTRKVEKRNVLDGTFMPSTSFTGGYRVCAYLDTMEPNHAILKRIHRGFLDPHGSLPSLPRQVELQEALRGVLCRGGDDARPGEKAWDQKK